jgi:hypothetical protein
MDGEFDQIHAWPLWRLIGLCGSFAELCWPAFAQCLLVQEGPDILCVWSAKNVLKPEADSRLQQHVQYNDLSEIVIVCPGIGTFFACDEVKSSQTLW